MKIFLALFALAIGLLVAMPPGSQVQATAADQVCFVADNGPTLSFAAIQAVDVQYVVVSCVEPQFIQKEGGGVHTQSAVAEQPLYFNRVGVMNTTESAYVHCQNRKYDRHRFRTKEVNLLPKNKELVGQIRIRSDTSV
jgi:hypothetical protein